jgi:hypothetical protein
MSTPTAPTGSKKSCADSPLALVVDSEPEEPSAEHEVRAWSEIYSRAHARAQLCVARKRVDRTLTVRSVDDAPVIALIAGGYHRWADIARWRGAFAGSRVAAKAHRSAASRGTPVSLQ